VFRGAGIPPAFSLKLELERIERFFRARDAYASRTCAIA